jgi:myosin heavy subunit
MEKLSASKRVTIVRQYLSGLSYDEIAAKRGVSKGTVANVISELKAGRLPEAASVAEDIELLRELSIDLKRSKLSPGQCATGLAVLNRISECGLNPADMERWPLILKSVGSEEEAQEFVRLVYSIQEVQERTGLSLDDLDSRVHELEQKAADLEPMSTKYEDFQKQIAELTRQREDLASTVDGLEEKYKLFNPRVKELEKREKDLARRIKDTQPRADKAEVTLTRLSNRLQQLQDIGLPFEALAEFYERLQVVAKRHAIKPDGLRDRLLYDLESLDKGIGLEAIIQSQQLQLEEQKQAIGEAKQESESIRSVIGSLKQEKLGLEASIKNTREKASGEIMKLTPLARDTINRLADEIRRGHNEALKEVRQLRDEAIEVGKEIGRYEGIVEANEWLNGLLDLARGEESLEGKRVRVIMLLVLRGTAVWLRHHKRDNLLFSPMVSAVENLIREVEQWQE